MSDFSFLDLTGFKARTLMPGTDVDAVETAASGWILQQLVDNSALIRARLDKRYGPWVAPYPIAILRWLEQLVTLLVYVKRGVNPSDEQFQLIAKRADQADAEIKEAANSETGLFDLPLIQGGASGVVNGGPQVYAEQSPYTGFDLQRADAVQEDSNVRR